MFVSSGKQGEGSLYMVEAAAAGVSGQAQLCVGSSLLKRLAIINDGCGGASGAAVAAGATGGSGDEKRGPRTSQRRTSQRRWNQEEEEEEEEEKLLLLSSLPVLRFAQRWAIVILSLFI